MNPETRNDLLVNVFDHITNKEEYFLGFKYDPEKQVGSCTCSTTGSVRFPTFAVKHNSAKSIIYFTSHHGDTARVSVVADEQFFFTALNKVKDKLQPYAGDWNDSQTNPFHPDYNEGGQPPEEG